MTLRRNVWTASLAVVVFTVPLFGNSPGPISDSEFVKLHRLIRPQPGESRWMEIDWYPSVWEARQKAASAGKPLFIMAGSGGAPVAGC